MQRTVSTIAILGVLFAVPTAAHHSGAAFDPGLPVEVSGTVAKVEWTIPHARLFVSAADAGGATVTWDFELPSPVTLMRRGWSRNSLKVGEHVTVTGIRAREHPHIAIARSVADADGKRLFADVVNRE
jgi:uncharacterized protein DUF6152